LGSWHLWLVDASRKQCWIYSWSCACFSNLRVILWTCIVYGSYFCSDVFFNRCTYASSKACFTITLLRYIRSQILNYRWKQSQNHFQTSKVKKETNSFSRGHTRREAKFKTPSDIRSSSRLFYEINVTVIVLISQSITAGNCWKLFLNWHLKLYFARLLWLRTNACWKRAIILTTELFWGNEKVQ